LLERPGILIYKNAKLEKMLCCASNCWAARQFGRRLAMVCAAATLAAPLGRPMSTGSLGQLRQLCPQAKTVAVNKISHFVNKKERKRENNSLVQGNIFPTVQRFGLDTATFSMVERAFHFGPQIALASAFVQ
jgi:hypothetical protein